MKLIEQYLRTAGPLGFPASPTLGQERPRPVQIAQYGPSGWVKFRKLCGGDAYLFDGLAWQLWSNWTQVYGKGGFLNNIIPTRKSSVSCFDNVQVTSLLIDGRVARAGLVSTTSIVS
jgi:hypothetical protein